jgi:hypothetical protein
VPFEGITLKTENHQKQHMTYNTLSFLAFLVTHVAMKQSRAKPAEMELLSKFIDFACTAVSLECKAVKPQHLLIQFSLDVLGLGNCIIKLVLTPFKRLKGMVSLLRVLPVLKTYWNHCQKLTALGRLTPGISSNMDSPTLWEFLRFLMWLNVNQPHFMELFGCNALHACMHCIAKLLEAYVIEHVVLAKLKPLSMPLPLLKGKKGKCRDTHAALKIAWVEKIKSAKYHNNMCTMALTDHLCPIGVQRLFEQAMVVSYFKKLKTQFGSVKRLQLSMDESHHTESTMVTTVYSPQNDMAAYAPIVVLNKATHNDLDLDELVQLAHQSKLTRLSAFIHIKALQQVLLGLGHELDNFMLPDQVLARPLTSTESRYQDPATKKWMVYNEQTQCATPHIPQNLDWDSLPLLTLCIDQASTGLACSQFLMEKMGILMLQQPDKFHRAWNDMKLSFKAGI